ncbi:unnamed protein product [Adineta ricciae]|uniref:Clathrin heavy chain n=1 Tax=Adineta ricciae TaxID=249248 RepID=A0A815MS03_ADIRI|nr:unnamed protein product [Adineta ricciae]CAF1427015.1 unnamed protein product [Adineta ricciae]
MVNASSACNEARYLVSQGDPALWEGVLREDNQHRHLIIDQLIQNVAPKIQDPDELSVVVKAFINADVPNDLIKLLEKVVLRNSNFCSNRNLSNLLILTAIKTDPTRVMDYINRLENFDASNIGEIATSAALYEEAFAVYKKFKMNTLAMKVLINNINDLNRAKEFAQQCNDSDLWSLLPNAQN